MLNHLYLIRTARLTLNAVSESFAPPRTASSKTVRLNGLVCILFGMACVVAFGGLALLLGASPVLLLLPSLAAYAFFTVGGYRLIRGQEPAPSHAAEISLARIALGCVSVLFCVALLFGLIAIAAQVLGWK